MNCEDILYNIDEILDGNFRDFEGTVRKHLDECPACRRNLDKWKKIRGIFSSSKVDATDSLKQKLLAIPDINNISEEPSGSLIPWRRFIYSAAAMFIFSLGLVYYFSERTLIGKPSQSQQTAVDRRVEEKKSAEFKVTLYLPGAETVSLVGDFNNWSKESLPLSRDESGNWNISLRPGKGYYQYQLLVDNKKWYLDPHNPVIIEDGFGGMNSGVLL